ncbi:MAG: hypothetical protein PHR28_12400 [candidate division Zixibacteria bacterium]|nr:hypothetical protein [candidate division Zixibacteria bacterium]
MRIMATIFGIIACLLMLAACGTTTPEKSALLTGKVTEADTSIALSGVKVFEKSHARLSCETDSLGIFKLDGVSFEEHNIYFEKDGYEPVTFLFEYNGKLSRPLLSQQIVMTKVGQTQ